jgi:CRISPR-associated protein Csb3
VTTTITIPVEVRNPGAYLAVCGLVEIIGAFDANSVSSWQHRPVVLGTTEVSATACTVQTTISEPELVAALLDSLSCRDRWEGVRLDGRRALLHEIGKDEPLTAVGVSIHLRDRHEYFPIDYWYHLLARADDTKLKDKLPGGKSIWKFWGGRMSLQKTLLGEAKKAGLIASLTARNGQPLATVAELLLIERESGSSLNLDAAARRGALDRGLAANEAKRATADLSAVRPGLELLAAIGLAAFFQPRRLGGTRDNGRHSTAGFDGKHLRYCLWAIEAPLLFARLLARGVQVPGAAALQLLEARRVNAGGKLYRFDYARGVGSASVAPMDTEEENDDGTDAG